MYIKVIYPYSGNVEICRKLLMKTLIVHHLINKLVFLKVFSHS